MSLRYAAVVVGVSMLFPVAAQTAAQVHAQITARIYHTRSVRPDQSRAALRIAADTLAAAGVTVSWKECDAGCVDAPDAGELVVRLVRIRGATAAADRLVLGDAYVDATHRAAVLATIYLDRVEQLARASETDIATLLGRAIAHELGHLLLASNTHSPQGLMRAQWTQTDLRRDRVGDWMFTERDAEAMRRRLQ